MRADSIAVAALAALLAGCAQAPLRGTGDLGLVVERASGRVMLIETTGRTALARPIIASWIA